LALVDVSIVTSGHDVADARLHRVCAGLLRAGLSVEVLGLGLPQDAPEGVTVRVRPRPGLAGRVLLALVLPWKARGSTLFVLDPDALLGARLATLVRRRHLVADVHEDYAALVGDRAWARGALGRLARLMVGREVLLRVEKKPSEPGEPLLDVRDLHVLDSRGLEAVRGVSFQAREGEIVGIAGVDGNGQSELIDALCGLLAAQSGNVLIAGEEVLGEAPGKVLDRGLGHIPEDRQRRGLVLEFTLAENLALHDYDHSPIARFGWLMPRPMIERARRLLKDFDVRGGGPSTRAAALSGGNQQKVVIAREVARDPRVLIAAQPTRGLDVGAIEYVHRRLVEARDQRKAVVLVSLELDEILSLSDRILVIYEGRLVAEYGPDVSEEELGIAMTGGREEDAA